MKPQLKIKRVRNVAYLKFIRTLPCSICHAPPPSQSHHTAGGGCALVGDDTSAVPICLNCHRDIHQHCSKRGRWSAVELAGLLEKYQELFQEWKRKQK